MTEPSEARYLFNNFNVFILYVKKLCVAFAVLSFVFTMFKCFESFFFHFDQRSFQISATSFP